jgi:hypothetical protein
MCVIQTELVLDVLLVKAKRRSGSFVVRPPTRSGAMLITLYTTQHTKDPLCPAL